MDQPRDTICALASGPPPSAIAIIRISGPRVQEICEQLLENGTPEPKTARLDLVKDLDGEIIDEGLALYMAGPKSYTGEDSLELYLHGGQAVVEHALQTLSAIEGVRLAEPGEFTRRAFEAGKLDLTQAEGVADVIEAETRAQKSQALRQLAGGLSATYDAWRDELLSILALLEAAIDFPDEGDIPDYQSNPIYQKIDAFSGKLADALSVNLGEKVRDGFRIAIIGPPNAGKSTLLNRLAGRDAAIVTSAPGTTRDVIEVRRKLGGQIVWIADTAGLRDTTDDIEAEGVRRARRAASQADLRIFLTSAESLAEPLDLRGVAMQAGDLVVLNKVDLVGTTPADAAHFAISAETGEGIEALEAALSDMFSARAARVEAPIITRARHREHLQEGLAHLAAAKEQLIFEAGPELIAEDVRAAIRELGKIVGTIGVEDVLGAVFSEFCIGK